MPDIRAPYEKGKVESSIKYLRYKTRNKKRRNIIGDNCVKLNPKHWERREWTLRNLLLLPSGWKSHLIKA